MLKVVGASREQTRATSYILILFTFCGLLIIIFGGSMTLSEVDGNYAATVYWQKENGYRIEFWGQGNILEELPVGSARGYYRQDIAYNGWSKIEIETSADYDDEVQAYSAGLLEGSLTWQIIFWRWKNTIEAVCEEVPTQCEQIRLKLNDWGERMRISAREQATLEPFWHQINLFFAQLDGLITGWNYSIRRNRSKHMEISNEDFLWLQLLATDVPLPDIPSLIPESPSLTSCLIKLHQKKQNASEEIILAQTTAAPYRDMLRVVKRYIFPFRMTSVLGSWPVPGVDLEFTGYPGALSSQDDLYKVTNRNGKHSLLVVGSTIGSGVRNGNFYKRNRKTSEEKVAGTFRALVASRLARDGRTWSAHFNRGRGGASVDKQWSILDLTKLNTDSSGLLWVVEQTSDNTLTSDLTADLRTATYWASYGLPHHQEVQLELNSSRETTERREVFEKCQTGCNKKEDVFHMIRHPVPPGQDSVGSRGDLYKENPVPFGVIDTKIITGSRDEISWQITAGPVHAGNNSSEVPPCGVVNPFQWSTSAYFLSVPHYGHPDIWSFEPQQTKWVY